MTHQPAATSAEDPAEAFAFGIEGIGSPGAGLCDLLKDAGQRVVEASVPVALAVATEG